MNHNLQLDYVVNKIRQELGVDIIEKDRKVIFSQLENQHKHLIEDHKLKIDLNNWLKRKKIFGKKVDFLALDFSQESFLAIECSAKSLSEKRKIKRREVPYLNQKVDQDQDKEGLWDEPKFTFFRNNTKRWPRKGSSQILNCENCSKRGILRCRKCNGIGSNKIICTICWGEGKIKNEDVRVGGSVSGPSGSVNFRKSQCMSCRGTGKMDKVCSSCAGKGDIVCPVCSGSRELYVYDEIEAVSSVSKQSTSIIPNAEVKKQWIKKSEPTHEMVYEEIYNYQPIGSVLTDVGHRYEMSIYVVNRVSFDFNGDKSIFIINGKKFPANPDFLLDKKKIGFMIFGFVVFLFLVFYFFYYVWE